MSKHSAWRDDTSVFAHHTNCTTFHCWKPEFRTELAQEGRAQQEDSGQSTPHDLISVMERQEAEEEAEAVALNGGVEPGTVVDYMREEVRAMPIPAKKLGILQSLVAHA